MGKVYKHLGSSFKKINLSSSVSIFVNNSHVALKIASLPK